MLLALALLLIAGVPTAHANTMRFATGPTMLGGVQVDVEARFTFDPTNHQIMITLLNFQDDPSGITQVLGSVRFNLTGAGTSPVPTMALQDGSTFGVDANGNPVVNVKPIAWNVSNIGGISGNQIALCATCVAGGNKGLVIGGPNAAGVYASANGAIKANNAHNPFIIGTNQTYATGVLHGLDTSPTWTITVPTETVTVAVSNVIFGFGTGINYGTTSVEVDVYDDGLAPEPGSWIMMLGGLGMILIGVRKRRAR